MLRKKPLLILIAVLIGLVALTFITASFLPYMTLKHISKLVMSDGNLKSLKDGNAIIFKILFGFIGVGLASAAFAVGFGYLHVIWAWLGQYFADLKSFFKAIKPDRSEWIAWAILGVIVILAALIRIPALNSAISHDEGYTFVVFANTSLFNIVSNYHLPNNHILNSILIFFSTRLFGIMPWAIRLPSLIAGLLIIPACFCLAKTIYDPYTGLISALMVAILPGAIIYSTLARGYTLVALCTLAGLLLAQYSRQNKNLFAWSMLVLFMVLGFFSVPVMLLPFGVIFVWLFCENLVTDPGPYRSKFNFLIYWAIAGLSTAVLVLLLYTPVLIYSGADKLFANQWVVPEPWAGYLATIPSYLLEVWNEWTVGIPITWLILIPAGVVLSLILHGRIARQRFPIQISAIIWLIVLLLVQRPRGVSKIWVFLQAPVMIWASAGIIGPIKTLKLKLMRSIPVASILIILLLWVVSVQAFQTFRNISEYWKDVSLTEKVVLTIKERLKPDDLIIVDDPYDSSIWYYSLLHGIPIDQFYQKPAFAHLFVVVSPGDGQTINTVLRQRGPDPAFVDLKDASFIANFQNLDIYELTHK